MAFMGRMLPKFRTCYSLTTYFIHESLLFSGLSGEGHSSRFKLDFGDENQPPEIEVYVGFFSST